MTVKELKEYLNKCDDNLPVTRWIDGSDPNDLDLLYNKLEFAKKIDNVNYINDDGETIHGNVINLF